MFVTGGPPGQPRIAILRPGSVVGEPGLFARRAAHGQRRGDDALRRLGAARPALEELCARAPALALELLRAAGAVMAMRMRANLERGAPLI